MRGVPAAPALAFLAALLAGPAQAGNAANGRDRTAIRQVITAQITAFRHDDAAAAFALAAPNIKARFGDGPHFLAMVRQTYPAVFRPRSFAFGSLTQDKTRLVQKVALVGPDGDSALALYSMEHEPDGAWRIAGCSLIKGASQEI